MKICTKCHIEKEESEFCFRLNHGKRRIDSWCKHCQRTSTNKWRKKNKKRVSEYTRTYIIKNKTRIRAREKKTREKRAWHYKTANNIRNNKGVQVLSDWYIRARLRRAGYSDADIMNLPILIDKKRLDILIRRGNNLIKNYKKSNNE